MASSSGGSSPRRLPSPAELVRWTLTLFALAFFALWACPPGDPCVTGADCDSGYCVAGVCCATACAGPCETCYTGTCNPWMGNNPIACNVTDALCGGVCDGVDGSKCAYPDQSVLCGAASCDAVTNTATPAAFCDGAGSCFQPPAQPCAPLMCGATQCEGGCAADGDCQSGEYCLAGVCVAKGPDGTACGNSAECANGFCVDGFCCATACTAQCEACDVAGSEGTCSPVTGAPHGNKPPCGGVGDGVPSPCDGACDGVHTRICAYPGAETTCPNPPPVSTGGSGNGSCAELTGVEDVCDGMGSCVGPPGSHCDHGLTGGGGTGGLSTFSNGTGGGTGGKDPGDPGPCACRAAGSNTGDEGWLVGLAVCGVFAARYRRRAKGGVGA